MKKIILLASFIFIFSFTAAAQDFLGKWNLSSMVIEADMAYPIRENSITLNINENGKIGGNGGCNAFGGSYKFEKPDKIDISGIISTKMFCEGTSDIENVFFRALEIADSLKLQENKLFINNSKKGNTLIFERHKETTTEKITLQIKSEKVSCHAVVPQKCYVVKYSDLGGWVNFYDEIEGFDFVKGYNYVIEVERTKVKNPPKDTSGYTYKLIRIVKKQPFVKIVHKNRKRS